MISVAINGYGRIGRIAHRVMMSEHKDALAIIAINAGSSTDLEGWKYLLEYDSVYGKCDKEIFLKPAPDGSDKALLGYFVIDAKEIPVYSQKDPALLPWKALGVDVVIESTGLFTKGEELKKHIDAGAKRVVLSAPLKDDSYKTIVLGVNTDDFSQDDIISNASCTTNCIAPVAKIVHDHFGIEKAMMTTVHGYTSDQKLHDGGHKDYRRARAAGLNIIPTSTGATQAAALTVPQLSGKFLGLSLRVPVPVGSLADCTFLVSKATTVEEINEVFKRESKTAAYHHILEVTTDPIVSSDIIKNPHSSIVDLSLTQVVGGTLIKVVSWYDNEYGYANRLVEQVRLIAT